MFAARISRRVMHALLALSTVSQASGYLHAAAVHAPVDEAVIFCVLCLLTRIIRLRLAAGA
jgi:hypothetical protein